MSIIGIIPARYDSSRFPGKALAEIHGKPMIRRVYERASLASRLDRLAVATDDVRIHDAVIEFGGESILTSHKHPSGTDRLAEASDIMHLSEGDIVVNVQGDEPLVTPEMIDCLIEGLEGSSDSPMATLAFASSNEQDYFDPNVVKVVTDIRGKALYFSRSPIPHRRETSNEPISFLKHLGFYAYRKAFLKRFTSLTPGVMEKLEKLEQLRALEHGYPIRVRLSSTDTCGIDTPEDLHKLLADSRYSSFASFSE